MVTRGKATLSLLAVMLAGCSSSSSGGNDFGTGTGGGDTTTTGTAGNLGSAGTLGAGAGLFGDSGTPSDAMDLGDGCGQTTINGSSKEVDILLVIDRSGSMSDKPAGFATDKWTALKTALQAALDPVKGGISFGVELFPNNLTTPVPVSCTTQCWDMPAGEAAIVVPVGPGTTTLPNIVAKLAPPPGGGTPTRAALQSAYDYFTSGTGKALAGDKYVLLATDGGPNGNTTPCMQATCTVNMDLNQFGGSYPNYCDAKLVADGPKSCLDDTPTETLLATMAARGIKTFVVGIPGTEPYVSTLDALAVAGGTPASATSPKYFAVTAAGGVDGLKQVFETITHQLIKTCRLQLQSNPPDSMLLNVTVDGKTILYGAADGWTLDSATSPATVVLKGATCSNVEMNGASSIQILYGCPTEVVK
jgi:hypothetical protein